jgi:quercetin dioxygenase-like cupin family protein
MSDPVETDDSTEHRRPHPGTLAAPFLEIDLERELEQFRGEPEWKTGQNARTLVKFDDFRIVLTALKAHERMPEHRARGRVSIHTVRGHVQVRALGRTFELPVGKLLALDRDVRHEVEALDEESAILITIAWPQETDRAAGRAG